MDVELEHGTRDPQTNVIGDDVIMTAKISRAHLNEFPDYYTRLAKMEAEDDGSRGGGEPDRPGGVSAQASLPLGLHSFAPGQQLQRLSPPRVRVLPGWLAARA